jgi:hypothetical protein
VITLLARFFRSIHVMIGISEPPPGLSDKRYVLGWLAGIAVVAVAFAVLLLVIPALYFRR